MNATAWFGVSAQCGRYASFGSGALLLAWICALVCLRDSKERWLTFAIVVQGLGGAALILLPSLEMTVPDGRCVHVIELGKALELAGLLYGLSATIWLAAGAWMKPSESRGLDKIDKPNKWKSVAASLFKSAHKQISMGLLTAFLGVVFVLWSTGLEVYTKHYGIEQPKERACKAR